jgi:hypothetical protein
MALKLEVATCSVMQNGLQKLSVASAIHAAVTVPKPSALQISTIVLRASPRGPRQPDPGRFVSRMLSVDGCDLDGSEQQAG